jgi:hypothetical protein
MSNPLDDRLDRYLAGELTPGEQRELAQAALDDPSLFDTLTAAALVKAAARDRAPAVEAAAPRSWSRNRLAVAFGGAMAAAAVVAVAIVDRPFRRTESQPPPVLVAAGPAAVPETTPAPPVPGFLMARNEERPDRSSPAFRTGADSGERLPKERGAVMSIDGDQVEIDLGSIDGIGKGSTVRLFRGNRTEPAATLLVTTVFRERSRGETTGAAAALGDRAEVGRADSVNALIQRASARTETGDAAGARQLASRAVERADARDVDSAVRRRALYHLGRLEHAAGALDDAVVHLRGAADAFDRQPVAPPQERADVLDELGAALIDRKEYAEAERVLREAPRSDGLAGVRVANNLAVLAEMRGDRTAAESQYRIALDLARTSSALEAERRVIQRNLDRLGSPR